MARDQTIYRWPPAIRLFNPFVPRPYMASAATASASLIEELEIKPFEITLDQLVILPNLKKLECQLAELAPPIDEVEIKTEEMENMEKMIEEEARKGYERHVKRKRKKSLKENQADVNYINYETPQEKIKREKLKSKKYNGPCTICIEPNEKSRLDLIQLRDTFSTIFGPYQDFGGSSSISSDISTDTTDKYRPHISLGNFATVNEALKIAENLQACWEPLSFNLTELHFLSSESHNSILERDLSDGTKNEFNTQMECDAMVFLCGAEQDEEDSDLLKLLIEQEMEDRDQAAKFLREEEESFSVDGEEDEMYDEGATIIIGRTHFFLGEMKQYIGMPAYPLDTSAGILGSNANIRNKK